MLLRATNLLLAAASFTSVRGALPLSSLSQYVVQTCGTIPVYFNGGVPPYSIAVQTFVPNELVDDFVVVATGISGTGTQQTYYEYATSTPAGSILFFRISDSTGASTEPSGSLVEANGSYVSGIPTVSTACLDGLTSPAAIPGTHLVNVSSSDTSVFQTTSGDWQSDTAPGYYEIYSNSTNATATFTFTGVGFTFFGARKVDRNEFYLAIDSGEQFIVYQGTGGLGSTLDNSWPTESLYTSPELAYGLHSVVMSQANYSQGWLVAQEWAYAVRDVLSSSISAATASGTATSIDRPISSGSSTSRTDGTASIKVSSATGTVPSSTAVQKTSLGYRTVRSALLALLSTGALFVWLA